MLLRPEDLPQVANEMMNMLHTEELEVFNRFHDAIVAKDIEKIDEIFPEILFDVEDHFSTEEQMMEAQGYGFYQMHKNDHDTMRKKLAKFHMRWEKLKSPTELQNFLENDFKQWIKLHISKWDSEAALHLNAAG